jgi:hypothetical protein
MEPVEVEQRRRWEAQVRRDERLWPRPVEALDCYPEELVQETLAESGVSVAGLCFGVVLWLSMFWLLNRARPGGGLALGPQGAYHP